MKPQEKRFLTSTLFEVSAILGSAGAYVSFRETNDLFRAILPLVLFFSVFLALRKNYKQDNEP